MASAENLEKIIAAIHQMEYRMTTSKIYNDLCDDLIANGVDYSNRLFKIIDEIVVDDCKDQFIKIIKSGMSLYRAREIKPEEYSNGDNGLKIYLGDEKWNTQGFNEKNSIECPIGMGTDGRNNIAGVSYLYVAEDVATACAEVKSTLRSLVSVARFEVKSDLKIIDFSTDNKKFSYGQNDEYQISLGSFFTLLMSQYCFPVSRTEDYRISQIVSDYIRKMGFDGVLYRSFFTMKDNYTIFNCHKSKIAYTDSKILSHQFSNDVFWDFNNQEAIQTSPCMNVEYDKQIADKILMNIKREFERK